MSPGDRSDASEPADASELADASEPADASELAEPLLGPAAHSMDTHWFAVDALGQVGLFYSGEGGAVPDVHFEQGVRESSEEDFLELLLREPARSGVRFDDHALFEPARRARDSRDRYEIVTSPEQIGDSNSSAIFELADASAANDPRLGAGAFGWAPRLPCERVMLTFAAQQLARLWSELGILRVRVPYDIELSRLGLFRFRCTDYSAGPYVRGKVPRVPLRVEGLSSLLRHRLSAVSFDAIDFRETNVVQPFEHLPSHAWTREWLGTDGEMHPVE